MSTAYPLPAAALAQACVRGYSAVHRSNGDEPRGITRRDRASRAIVCPVRLGTITYRSHTWNANLNPRERIVKDELKRAAVVVVTAVCASATASDALQRFAPKAMPAQIG